MKFESLSETETGIPAEDGDASWMKLAAARRRALQAESAEFHAEGGAPFGFASRLAARACAQRREALLGRWTRWSLGGALASAFAAVVVALWPAPDSSAAQAPLLLRAPSMEIPSLASR